MSVTGAEPQGVAEAWSRMAPEVGPCLRRCAGRGRSCLHKKAPHSRLGRGARQSGTTPSAGRQPATGEHADIANDNRAAGAEAAECRLTVLARIGRSWPSMYSAATPNPRESAPWTCWACLRFDAERERRPILAALEPCRSTMSPVSDGQSMASESFSSSLKSPAMVDH